MFRVCRVVFVLFLSSLLLACAQLEKKSEQARIYWPLPPDPPRFVYEAPLKTEDSIRVMSREIRLRRAVTGEAGGRLLFRKPFGVAAGAGLVVVTDTVLRHGIIINLRRQKAYRFGHVGNMGRTIKPAGVALGVGNEIFVADISARRVYVYDSLGMYLRTIGSPDQFDRPVGVAVAEDGSRVYVVDAGGIDSRRHRVLVFGRDGELLSAFGARGTGHGEFNLPTGITVTPGGNVLVLDAGNFRIQEFSADGRFLKAWGEVGTRFGDFARPRGIATDSDGNVYVTDAAFRNMQVFNSSGQLLLTIDAQGRKAGPIMMGLPAGVAVDERGFVFMVDQLYAQVDVLRRLSPEEMEEIVAKREDNAKKTENQD